MPKTLIGFTDEQIKFAVSLSEYALKQLQKAQEESHSGVDRLLYGDWIASAEEIVEVFKAEMPQNEPETPFVSVPRPEA